MTLRRLFARCSPCSANRLDRELDDEVLAHLELAEHDALGARADPAEARREALRQFGGIDQMKEVHRDDCSARWIENLFKDVRYGLAGLRREPGFALVAVGVLALGIGANTAMFSLVDGALFRPLPSRIPIASSGSWNRRRRRRPIQRRRGTFEALKTYSRSFEAMSAESLSTATVMVDGEPTRLNGRYVSADHFAVFGIQPLIGPDVQSGRRSGRAQPAS